MAKYIPIILTVVGTIAATVFTPTFVHAHLPAFTALNVIAQIIHAALPSVTQ